MNETTTATGPLFSTYEPYGPPDPDARVPEPRRPLSPSYDATPPAGAERTRRRFHPIPFIVQKFGIVNVICVAIWAMTDFGGYFWPMWVMLGTGIPVLLGVSTLNAVSSSGTCGGRRR